MPAKMDITPDMDLQEIMDAAAPGTVLHLQAGVYRQKTLLRTSGITLEGDGMDKTVIIYDDYALKKDEIGREYHQSQKSFLESLKPAFSVHELVLLPAALAIQPGAGVLSSVCSCFAYDYGYGSGRWLHHPQSRQKQESASHEPEPAGKATANA